MSRAQWRIADRYELFHELGSGVCGSVWFGRDLRTGAEHAVKVLEPGLGADGDAVHGYYVQLGAVARLAHPNIVAADEVVAVEGRIALAMRRVPGVDLTTLLNTEGLPRPDQAALMAAQLADGLAAAHAVGVTHGDLKLANVLCEPGEDGLYTARLTDFGMGLLVPPSATEILAVLPPAEYRAPELSIGDTGTAAADVYALGILLYEALAGRPPFYGTHPDSIAELHSEMRPPWIRGLPELLWPPLASCLEKRPEGRPGAAELAGLLRDIAGLVEPEPGFDYRAGPAFAAVGVSRLTGAAQRAADAMTIALAAPSAVAAVAAASEDSEAGSGAGAGAGTSGALVVAQRPYKGVAGVSPSGHAGPRAARAARPPRRRGVRVAEIAAAVVGVAVGITLAVTGSNGTSNPNGLGAAGAVPFVALSPGPVGVAASGSADPSATASASASASPSASLSASASVGPSASASASAARVVPSPSKSSAPPSQPAVSPSPPLPPLQGRELVSNWSRKCLDTSNARFWDGAAIVLFTCDRDAGEGWTYTSSGQLTQDNGAYCLDDTGWSTQPGTRMQLWACSGNQNQQWVLHWDGSITNAFSGLCLDVTDHGTADGTPIEQWDCNGRGNQQWSFQ